MMLARFEDVALHERILEVHPDTPVWIGSGQQLRTTILSSLPLWQGASEKSSSSGSWMNQAVGRYRCPFQRCRSSIRDEQLLMCR